MTRGTPQGVGLCCLLMAGCAGLPWEGKEHRVALEDNVGGKSAARIEAMGHAVQVQVDQFADGCRLQQFLVGPRPAAHGAGSIAAPRALAVRAPDVVEGGRATLDLYAPGDWIVQAQYVHNVLVDEGRRSEPDGEAPAWGAGDLQVGRPLKGGYRFDHVEFSSRVRGPGGASARVSRYPTLNSLDATTTIHWYYDEYSKVGFQWKVYARGPCDAAP